jgi:hypothetical protein
VRAGLKATPIGVTLIMFGSPTRIGEVPIRDLVSESSRKPALSAYPWWH